MRRQEASNDTNIEPQESPALRINREAHMSQEELERERNLSPAERAARASVSGEEFDMLSDDSFNSRRRESIEAEIENHKNDLEKCPDSIPIKGKLAELYMEIDDFCQALEYYNDIVDQREDTWTYYNLGTIYLRSGDRARAREYLNKALELDPNNVQAKYNLGVSYMGENDVNAAKEFQEIISGSYSGKESVIDNTHNNLGVCYSRTLSDKADANKPASEEFYKAGYIGIKNLLSMLRESFGLSADDEQKQEDDFSELIGNSDKIKELKAKIHKAAASEFVVRIQGETGTGKELVARAIHNLSNRKDKKTKGNEDAFIAINCGGLDPEMMKVELFGAKKGSYTGSENISGAFEVYSEGTIFLDEIGKLSSEGQTRLLRVLSSNREFREVGGTKAKKTNVRIIVADSKDLDKAVKDGKFSAELLGRLDVINIEVSPLREHPEDIPDLIHYFLYKHTPKGKEPKIISDSAMLVLKEYKWEKYNVRELENEIQSLIAMVDEKVIYPHHLKSDMLNGTMNTEDKERELIISVLKETKGNESEAAKLMKCERSKFRRKREKYKIDLKDYKPTENTVQK